MVSSTATIGILLARSGLDMGALLDDWVLQVCDAKNQEPGRGHAKQAKMVKMDEEERKGKGKGNKFG